MPRSKVPDTLGFCRNARRWLVGAVDPRSCPHLVMGEVNCIGEGCGYYQERKPTRHIRKRLECLYELAGREEESS